MVTEAAALPSSEVAKGSSSADSRPSRLWLVLAVGSGGGYYSGAPEMSPQDTSTPPKDIDVSGFGLARLLHVAPEIGYFHSDHWVFSAQGRFQYVTGAQDVHLRQNTYKPAKMAFAGLAKVNWLLGKSGNLVSPFDVVPGGNRAMHAVLGGLHDKHDAIGHSSKDRRIGGDQRRGAIYQDQVIDGLRPGEQL